MSDEPSDTAPGAVRGGLPLAEWGRSAPEPQTAPRRHRRRTDWRQGGRAVSRWDTSVLAAVGIGGGAGVVVAGLVARIPAPWAPAVSLLVLWAGMLAAVAFAFTRARPAGLLALRPTDLVWGVGVGLALRAAQGFASGANSAPFPSSNVKTGEGPAELLGDALAAGLAGPFVEEFFFRAVLLVALFQLLRRNLGYVAAALTATLVSAGAFICLHAAFASLSLADGLQLFFVGAACAALVVLTGRIWGAVLAHVVYNVTFVLLGLIGVALA